MTLILVDVATLFFVINNDTPNEERIVICILKSTSDLFFYKVLIYTHGILISFLQTLSCVLKKCKLIKIKCNLRQENISSRPCQNVT
jgi:hypothetical protein